ncbi:hypothetical protein Tco_0457997 [Tanacetum coccineum]
MDSIIPLGQKNTLAEYMILSGADNRPPMLDKDLFPINTSLHNTNHKSNQERRKRVEKIEHGPLIWPTIEENGVTRTKKYVELSAAEKIQADYDIKATNVILQGLPADIFSLVNHHRLVKDLHTTKFDQLHAYLEQHELYANEVRLLRERNQDPLAFVANQQMTPPHFNTYQSSYNNPQLQQHFVVHVFSLEDLPIACLNKAMAFLTVVASLRYKSNATSSGGTMQADRKGLLNATTFKVKDKWLGNALSLSDQGMQHDLGLPDSQAVQIIIPNNVAFQTKDLNTYDSNYDDISNA